MMTTSRILAALLLSPLSLASAASPAPDPDAGAASGDYWGVHGGKNDLDRLDLRAVYASGTAYNGHADLSHGSHVGVQLGRRSAHARYELEFEAGDFRVRHLAVGPISADIDARGHYQAAFANIYRTERLGAAVGAFAGAGIGWGRTSLPHLVMKSACTCYGAASDSGFAWQLRAGLAYRVSDLSEVSLQYTRLRLPGAETAGPPAVHYARLGVNAWSLGWTSRF
jgi:opacity protein-like surface antigen